jgi:hypothetical protein
MTITNELRTRISPRLYRLTAISSHDTFTSIYTDPNAVSQAESDIWNDGGICSTLIDYADESIDGEVNWIESEESP